MTRRHLLGTFVVGVALVAGLGACGGATGGTAASGDAGAAAEETTVVVDENGLKSQEFENVTLVDNDAVTITLEKFFQKESNWARSSGKFEPLTTDEVVVKIKDKTEYGTHFSTSAYLNDEKLYCSFSGGNTVEAGKTITNSYTIAQDTQPDFTPLESFEDLYNVVLSFEIMKKDENGSLMGGDDEIKVEVNLGDAIGKGSETAEGDAEETKEPELTNEDFAGYWVPDGNEEKAKKGTFGFYRFKKNGTFQFIGNLQSAEESVIPGTYEVRDNKAYITVKLSEASLNLKDSEIGIKEDTEDKQAEAVLDGDTMTVTGLSDSTVTAHKFTKQQIKELQAVAAAAAPVEVAAGDTISGDGYTFTVNSVGYQDEIYPSDTSGYYRYYVHDDSSDYFVADITYVNDGTDYAVPGYSTAAAVLVGENKYSASVETDGGANILQSYRTEAKDTSRIVIFASVPNAAIEEGGDAKIYWSVPKDGSLLNTYYSSDNDNTMYVISE